MRPLTTLLYTLAACGVLLATVGYAVRPGRTVPDTRPAGLTAATILATDGMSPDGGVGRDAGIGEAVRPVEPGAGGIARAASGAARPAG